MVEQLSIVLMASKDAGLVDLQSNTRPARAVVIASMAMPIAGDCCHLRSFAHETWIERQLRRSKRIAINMKKSVSLPAAMMTRPSLRRSSRRSQ